MEMNDRVEALKRLLGPNALTLAQVGERLHVSESTVRRMLGNGVLPPPMEFGPTLKRYVPELIAVHLAETIEPPPADPTRRGRGRPRKEIPFIGPWPGKSSGKK